MSGWGDWQSPDEAEAIRRSAEEAQKRAGMTDFEKQALKVQSRMVDVLDGAPGVFSSRFVYAMTAAMQGRFCPLG